MKSGRDENSLKDVKLSGNNDFEIEVAILFLKSDYGYDIEIRSIRPKFSKYPQKRFPAVLRTGGGWG